MKVTSIKPLRCGIPQLMVLDFLLTPLELESLKASDYFIGFGVLFWFGLVGLLVLFLFYSM